MYNNLTSFSAKLMYLSLLVGYFVSGHFLSYLSFHSQIMPVWVPAGIALVGCYLWGWRFLPAVFIASFTFNYSVIPNFTLANLFGDIGLSTAIIALGSTLQAGVGGTLLRQWLGNPIEQPSNRKILFYIFIVGLLINLISSNIGIMSLTTFNANFAFGEYWLNMFYWWLGDSIGVLLITPILLSLIDFNQKKSDQQKIRLITITSASFLFFVVLFMTHFFIRYANEHSEDSLTREINVIENSLYRELNKSLSQLQTLARYIQSSPKIQQSDFNEFAKEIATNDSTIHAMSWNPIIKQNDVRLKEEELSKIYGNKITITGMPLLTDDPIVYVKYIYPEQGNEKAIGFNVYSNEKRKITLDKAKSNYYPQATPPIQLVQSTSQQPAYLLFIPVFRSNENIDGNAEKTLKGFATGVFLINKIIEKSFNIENEKLFHYQWYEQEQTHWFAANTHNEQDNLLNNQDVKKLTFPFAGQVWQLYITPNKESLKQQQSRSQIVLFIFQLMLVIFIMTVVLLLNNRHLVLNDLVKKRTNSLHNAMKSSKLANQAKSRFLANMSHEIRTPLNSVVGFAQIAKSATDVAEIKSYLAKIEISSDILLNLVNDILDFSKIETGKLTLSNRQFNMHRVLLRIATIFESMAENNNLQWQLINKLPQNINFIGDQTRIEQILVNLCGNAVKFTKKGSVTLSAELVEQKENNAKLKITVKDTGIGISKENQKKLFKVFSQADDSTSRNFGGSGLGLAISKEICQLMAGEITINSEEGKGAEFTFTLQLEVSPEVENIDAEYQPKDLSQLNVLVAEDNRINQTLIKTILNKYGISPTIVENGLEAVEKVTVESFDVILMDCQMPVLDGYQATEQIRKIDGLQYLPIIALTADANIESIERAKSVGFTEHLSKPINVEQVIKSLEKIAK